jgi:hypothetical protein
LTDTLMKRRADTNRMSRFIACACFLLFWRAAGGPEKERKRLGRKSLLSSSQGKSRCASREEKKEDHPAHGVASPSGESKEENDPTRPQFCRAVVPTRRPAPRRASVTSKSSEVHILARKNPSAPRITRKERRQRPKEGHVVSLWNTAERVRATVRDLFFLRESVLEKAP